MKSFIQVLVFHIAIQCCEIVKCSPHRPARTFQKSFHFEISPIPLQHFSFLLEKITPFRRYEFKHVIKKRQISENDNSPVSNEIPFNVGPIVEDVVKLQDVPLQKDSEVNLIPEVIITSVIKPIEDTLPVDSVEKIRVVSVEDVVKETPQPGDIIVQAEPVTKIEEVVPPSETIVEITPKPIELPPPPPEPQPQNVGIVPQLAQIPIFSNPNIPALNPVTNIPPLYTDITKIPLIGLPNPTPVIPVPEYSVPPLFIPPSLPPPPPHPAVTSSPLPPPPPIKEEPPVIKEETPNFFVKGSRFVLYFGSMMLQMLSQLVNGHINLNHPIDIPILAGVQ